MTFNRKVIGATALMLCMMVVAVVPMLDTDSAATPNEEFADDVNAYAADVLGTNGVIVASTTGSSLTITVNTDVTTVNAIDLDLYQPYEKFKTKFAPYTVGIYDNYGEAPDTQRSTITVIQNGELKNVSDFGIRFLQTVKDAVKDGQSVSNYNGTIIINGNEYTLTITVNICDPLKTFATRMFVSGPIEVTANYDNGVFQSFGLIVKMDQKLFDVLGYSQAELKNAKVADVVAKFAADNVLATLVEDADEREYIDLLCGKINSADNVGGFIKDSLKFTCDGTDVAFTQPTVSTKAGFQGLMETVSSAMAQNFTKPMGDYSSSTVGGAINFKPMGIKILSGTNLFGTLNVVPVISYGQAVTVNGSEVAGGTVTVSASSALAGDSVTVTVTPTNPSFTITSVSYMVGNDKKADLEPVASQSVRILFEEGVHSFTATFDQQFYTVTWKNYDGTVLETDENVAYGTEPSYDGATPTRAATDKYSYEFIGWEPAFEPVTANVVYTAKYLEIIAPATTETEVTFISDTDEETIGAKISDIQASDKDNVVIGKDSASADITNWTVAIPKSYFTGKAADKNVVFAVSDVSDALPADIPADQKEKLEGMTVIAINMSIGSDAVHQIGEKVKVRIAYTLKDGESADNLYVYYVDTETGKMVKFDATYADGYVEFETEHFSYWAIGGEIIDSMKNSNLLLAALLISAIILPIIAALVIYRRQ